MTVLSKKTLHFLVYRVLIPAVVLAAILYVFFVPPSFSMGADYVFHPASGGGDISTIQAPGGKTLLGPSHIRLWGRYPYVCGSTGNPDAPVFSLNMESHEFRTFSSAEDGDFQAALKHAGCTMDDFLSLRELFSRGERAKECRLLLRELLRPPVRRDQ